jgi:hypothetical protein
MDPAADFSKLYRMVDIEMTLFIASLALFSKATLGKREARGQAERHLTRVLDLARKIGGKFLKDVETLDKDFRFFLNRPFERTGTDKVLQDALRIKHEVSEL